MNKQSEPFILGPNQTIWLDNLRSGKFKQGRTRLYDSTNDSYCCLGIANKVCGLGETDPHYLFTTYEKLGLRNESGLSKDGTMVLTSLNDGSLSNKRKSFAEIADLIEANLEQFFSHSA